MEERREHPRRDIMLKVEYSAFEKPDDKIEAASFNISLGGIGMRLNDFIKSKKLYLYIYPPREIKPIEARGILVWQSNISNFGERRAGIQFTEVPWTRLKALVA